MTADGPVVSQLMRYLDEADRHGRRWAIDPAPLRQDVSVERGQWEPLVPRLDGEVRNGVSSALARIRSAGERIDRRLLMAASERAGGDGAERVACWFLVMVWGGLTRSTTASEPPSTHPINHHCEQPMAAQLSGRL